MGHHISKVVKTDPVQLNVNEKEKPEKDETKHEDPEKDETEHEDPEKKEPEQEESDNEDNVSIVCNNFIHE